MSTTDERYVPVWLPSTTWERRPQGCQTCGGTGARGNDDEHAPWSFWATLTPPSDLAVRAGLVYPIRCDTCGGTGLEVIPPVPLEQLKGYLLDVEQQAYNMRNHWADWDKATRLEARDELACRAGDADRLIDRSLGIPDGL